MDQHKSPSEHDSNIPSPPPLFALVIGINTYLDPRYPSLRAASRDADDFNQYLISGLSVPEEHIINLRDTGATRDAILHAFEELTIMTATFSTPSRSLKNSLDIIVFFSGHGTRSEKPEEWEDWITDSSYYEALCPCDIGTIRPKMIGTVQGRCEIPAIPDRTIATLVNRLSGTRGNHITLIFDCCHSAGASRTTDIEESEPFKEGYVPRYISSPPALPHDYDQHHVSATLSHPGAGEGAARGFSGKKLSSRVLLAACGKEQIAHEHPEKSNGVFTYALLRALNNPKIDVQKLTYTNLMRRLNMPYWQNAHCEGVELDRRLFNHRIQGGDPRFILGENLGNKNWTLNAGMIQGITVGCIVTVHQSNLFAAPKQPYPSIGTLMVKAVDSASASLVLPPIPSPTDVVLDPASLPRWFYCRVIQRPSEHIDISSNDMPWLERSFSPAFRTSHSIVLVPDAKAADIVFTLEGEKVSIDHNFPLAATHIGTRSPRTIPSKNISLLHQVVRSAISFRFHFSRTNPSNPLSKMDIKMEFHELTRSNGSEFDFDEKPSGRDIFESDPAVVVVNEDKKYGATIHNLTNTSLYPHLFYFDPSELSIIPWYLPPRGAGTASSHFNQTDVILPPGSSFAIGYGGSETGTWEFMLFHKAKKDVGFFKLFVTAQPLNLGNISQDSPYGEECSTGRTASDESDDAAQLESGPDVQLWGTIDKTIVQVERGYFDSLKGESSVFELIGTGTDNDSAVSM